MEPVEKPVDILSGMIIATADGQISHISHEASEILFWANQYAFKPGSRKTAVETASSQVKYLCRCLTDIFHARHAPPPMLEINHRGGRVSFRAYWLENVTGSGQQLVNIMVTWQKPLELAMMERLREMPLSPKQKEICLMIGLGRNSHQISDSLGISQTTYKDHLQKIYRKLGVGTRYDLVALLLGYANDGPLQ